MTSMEIFPRCRRLERNRHGARKETGKMAIEAYVEALERTILSHDLNVKCQRKFDTRRTEGLREFTEL